MNDYFAGFPLKSFSVIKPTRKITKVPSTIVKLLCNGLLNANRLLPSVKYRGDKLIHIITITPMITPITASIFLTFLDKNANRKRPSIPPLNIDAKDHQASKMLSTPTSDNEITIPKTPNTVDEI